MGSSMDKDAPAPLPDAALFGGTTFIAFIAYEA
jgi:hypothetical protein